MAKSNKAHDRAVNKVVADFTKNLSDDHRMLVILKARLYGGTWEPMLEDLRTRLKAKSPIHSFAKPIKDDIDRIEEMQKIEAAHNIDLSDYVDLEG